MSGRLPSAQSHSARHARFIFASWKAIRRDVKTMAFKPTYGRKWKDRAELENSPTRMLRLGAWCIPKGASVVGCQIIKLQRSASSHPAEGRSQTAPRNIRHKYFGRGPHQKADRKAGSIRDEQVGHSPVPGRAVKALSETGVA